jgi:RNA polymerase sigma-54 factor
MKIARFRDFLNENFTPSYGNLRKLPFEERARRRNPGFAMPPLAPAAMQLKQLVKQSQSLRQMQRLIMSPQMQQAIQLMQLPILELANRLEQELVENPLLEPSSELARKELESQIAEESDGETAPETELSFDEHQLEILRQIDNEFRDQWNDLSSTPHTSDDDKRHAFLENSLCAEETLFNYLMQQARETFADAEKLAIAELLIGNLEESGLLTMDMTEIAAQGEFDELQLQEVLTAIQQFDPPGIAARSLQESLMLQLKAQGKEHSLAYTIIANGYQELIHNQIPQLAKKIATSVRALNRSIADEICKLELHPAGQLRSAPAAAIIPDVTIRQEGEKLSVVINDDELPPVHFNRRYLHMLEDEKLPLETREFIKEKILAGQWLMRTIAQRHETLEKVCHELLKWQHLFFSDPSGDLVPLSMKAIARELNLHESTVARAVANKYLYCDRGIFPLRSFFSHGYQLDSGKSVVVAAVRDALAEFIAMEDKAKPLSDEALAEALVAKGIPCARRTVAKYRAQLKIPNAHQRRRF